MKDKKIIFGGAVLALIALFFITKKVYQTQQQDKMSFIAEENFSTFVRDHSPTYGEKDAKVYLTEFLDPECESCRAFYPLVKGLLKEFDGKVKLVVRYAAFHKNSTFAIKALEAARKQGKYWESLEILFKHQPKWGDHHHPQPHRIFEFLPEVEGLDVEELKNNMNDPAIEKMIAQDFEDLKKLGVRRTPSFFINGKPLQQFGLEYLKEALAAEIKLAY